MKNEMPWPPQPSDQQPEKFIIPSRLDTFLKVVLTGSVHNNQISGRIAKLKLSFAQDIVYAVSEGKIKTPKSILLSSTIKT